MMKMISVPTPTTNLQSDILNNVGVIDRWDRRKFRIVEISSSRNQCLQFCLNAFYHDINYMKQATILWSCVHWIKLGVCMINDNAFVFNRMLGYNTAIYDEVDKSGNLIGSMILPQRASSSLMIITLHIYNHLQFERTKILTKNRTSIKLLTFSKTIISALKLSLIHI